EERPANPARPNRLSKPSFLPCPVTRQDRYFQSHPSPLPEVVYTWNWSKDSHRVDRTPSAFQDPMSQPRSDKSHWPAERHALRTGNDSCVTRGCSTRCLSAGSRRGSCAHWLRGSFSGELPHRGLLMSRCPAPICRLNPHGFNVLTRWWTRTRQSRPPSFPPPT